MGSTQSQEGLLSTQKLQDVCAQVSCHSDGPHMEGQTEDHPRRRTRNTKMRWEEGKRACLWVPGRTASLPHPGLRASPFTGCQSRASAIRQQCWVPRALWRAGTAGPCWPGVDSLWDRHTWQEEQFCAGGEAGERLDEIYRWQRP